MKLRVPHYYDEFKCIAGECKDNCCFGGWQIDIDDDTYECYSRLEGQLGERLRESIDVTDGYSFKLKDGRCPFLLGSGLCELHSKLGEENLSVVCRQFPRFSEYYGSTKESGIGMACEEAERLILFDERPFSLKEKSIDEEFVEDKELDVRLLNKIFSLREYIFELMKKNSYSIHELLIAILDVCQSVQECINDDNTDEITKVINNFKNGGTERAIDRINQLNENGEFDGISVKDSLRSVLYAYEDMEILSEEWRRALDSLIEELHDKCEEEEYRRISEEYMNYIKERNSEYKNFLIYLVYRYFCKACFDHNVLGKAQMLAAHFLVLKELDMNRWLKNKKVFTKEDRIRTVHMFSRQVEYSLDNIEVLYEDFIFDDIFTSESLKAILWIDCNSL